MTMPMHSLEPWRAPRRNHKPPESPGGVVGGAGPEGWVPLWRSADSLGLGGFGLRVLGPQPRERCHASALGPLGAAG
jgi:hypothetical protein